MNMNQLLLLIGELYSNLRLTETRVQELENENTSLRSQLEAASTAAMMMHTEVPEMDRTPEGEDDGSA